MRRYSSLIVGVLLLMAAAMIAYWPQPGPQPGAALKGRFTLALSWQPSFCETASGKPECRTQTAARADASQLSLHGLWPEPNRTYCGVPDDVAALDLGGRWRDLPAPDLSAETRAALERAMPGTQSFLDRHEWIKHGTCAGVDAETYFARSIALLGAVNQSALGKVLGASIGRTLTRSTLDVALEPDFGPGAADRVAMDCAYDGGRRLLLELRFALEGEIGLVPDISTLLAAAPRNANRSDCTSGLVDRAGLQ